MGALQGWQGRVQIQSPLINLPVTRWQVSWQIEKTDITNAEDSYTKIGPYAQRTWESSYATVSCSFDCLWDTTIIPFRNTNSLTPGSSVSVHFYLIKEDRFCDLDNCLIESAVMESEIRGVIKYTITGTQATLPQANPIFPIS